MVKLEYQDCKRGYAGQRNNLGDSYQFGTHGASRNYSQAVKYYQQACDGGYAKACGYTKELE